MTAEYQLAADGMIWTPPKGPLIIPNPDDPLYQAYLAWVLDGGVPDPAPVGTNVPAIVTRWQAFQIMLQTPSTIHPSPATLFTDVLAIAQGAGGAMLLAFQNQGYVYRHGQFVATIATQLNLSDATLDALFIAAAAVPP